VVLPTVDQGEPNPYPVDSVFLLRLDRGPDAVHPCRPMSANSGHSQAARRAGHIDPRRKSCRLDPIVSAGLGLDPFGFRDDSRLRPFLGTPPMDGFELPVTRYALSADVSIATR
jgi:hypothetical protein